MFGYESKEKTMKQNRNRGGQQRSRRSQNPELGMVMGTGKRYARALLGNEQDTLNKMTLYQQGQGAIGTGQSNVSTLKNSGATSIKRVLADGKQAMVLFGNDTDSIACIGLFRIIDHEHVLSGWTVFAPIK
jgi:hypothetical protein